MSWYRQHRMEWISECLSVYGFINRAHIQRKFGLSQPQASVDLKAYMKKNPKAMFYDPNAKCYKAAALSSEGESTHGTI